MCQFDDQIRRLRDLDPSRRVFGARSHGYEFTPVSWADLAEFESWCGCGLPEQYRRFVVEMGVGAGPYFGLLPFAKVREELELIYEDHWEDQGERVSPSDRFRLDTEVAAWRASETAPDFPCDGPQSPGGFLPICHQGCEFMTVLVTSGSCSGMVFDTTAFAGAGSRWLPAKRPPGIVSYHRTPAPVPRFPVCPTFTQWIVGWLEQCFHDLEVQEG